MNLHSGEDDKQKVLNTVTANISFKGSILWILACVILIASVGLNVNSAAVIIGLCTAGSGLAKFNLSFFLDILLFIRS